MLHHLDVEHDAIRRRARQARNLDGLKIIQILEAALGTIDQRLVVGVALGNVEFTPDHVVPRPGVAVDFDAFEVGPRPLIDHEGDIDAPRIGVAGGAWDGLREGKA